MWLGRQVLATARQRVGRDRRAVVTTATTRPTAAGAGPHRVAGAGRRSDRLMSGPPVTMIVALAVYLFMIGTLLGRTATNLGDCLQNVRTIAGQAQAIGPGIKRLNTTGGELVGAMPLLLDDVDAVTAKLNPAATASSADPAPAPTTSSSAAESRSGYLDPAPTTGVGYLDV